MPETQNKDHEDHIAETGFNSMSHFKLVHKPIPMPQAMKILDAKATVDKEQDKLKNTPAWQASTVKSKQQVIDEARMDGRTVHFAKLTDSRHPKNSKSGQEISQNTKDVLHYVETLWKMSPARMQRLPSRDLPRHTCQPPKFWMFFPDFQDAQDKQLMQYRLTLQKKWKTRQSYGDYQNQRAHRSGFSATNPPPEIIGQNSSSRHTSRKKFVRSPLSRTGVGTTK